MSFAEVAGHVGKGNWWEGVILLDCRGLEQGLRTSSSWHGHFLIIYFGWNWENSLNYWIINEDKDFAWKFSCWFQYLQFLCSELPSTCVVCAENFGLGQFQNCTWCVTKFSPPEFKWLFSNYVSHEIIGCKNMICQVLTFWA